jgi:hypothetical protein
VDAVPLRCESKPAAPAGAPTTAPATAPADAPDDATGEHGPLVCAACELRITDDAHRVARAGAHEHTFVNPGGFVYRVCCFAVATGCSYRGAPDPAFSWFPGFTWQIAACGRCRAHLGWIFRAAGESFHGLIADAIRPASNRA